MFINIGHMIKIKARERENRLRIQEHGAGAIYYMLLFIQTPETCQTEEK